MKDSLHLLRFIEDLLILEKLPIIHSLGFRKSKALIWLFSNPISSLNPKLINFENEWMEYI